MKPVDVGLRHQWTSQVELMEYMTSSWTRFLGKEGAIPSGGLMPLNGLPAYSHPYGDYLPEAYPADGEPGSNYQLTREQLLDELDLQAALLVQDLGLRTAVHPNPRLATEIARASNDWTIDRWLDGRDDRLFGTVQVASQLPDAAAAEVRRVGAHPRMLGVVVSANGLDKPFGHPAYHPIYEAAEECGLVVVLVSGGNAEPEELSQPTAAGTPATYAEYEALLSQPIMTHITSFMGQGVFDKFPGLNVLVLGCGITWITSMLWRSHSLYQGLRREVPWMRRQPMEYFRDHVRVGTHPFVPVSAADSLEGYLGAVDGIERCLCFASGYPRSNADDVAVLASFPESWRQLVAHENASRLLPAMAGTEQGRSELDGQRG